MHLLQRQLTFEAGGLIKQDGQAAPSEDFAIKMGRKIALVILGKGRWILVQHHTAEIAAAVDAATPGSYIKIEILPD